MVPQPLLCCVWRLRPKEKALPFLSPLLSLSPCPGFDMTPNYVDSNPTGIVVSPWCSCRGSGNMEEECEKFLRDFTENPCLRKSEQVLPRPPSPRGALEACLCHALLSPLGWPVIVYGGFPSDPQRTWALCSWRLILLSGPGHSGQPEFTTGGLEPMSGQGRKFLVCYPEGFSQVPSGTAL